MARRRVGKESGKWRSGRERERVGLMRPTGRGGKTPPAFGDDECVAAKHDRYVVVPAAESSTLVMVQTQLPLALLVYLLGSISLLHQSHQLLLGGVARHRRQEVSGRFGLVFGPLDQEPDVLALRRIPSVVGCRDHTPHREARRQPPSRSVTPRHLAVLLAVDLTRQRGDADGLAQVRVG